ncbi:hypothetical protein C8R48DRAFT_671337 [Suillus tomentosus]|nr:hypothetical protein C8R48DRAFT_671337 [Suillus tomentosus]
MSISFPEKTSVRTGACGLRVYPSDSKIDKVKSKNVNDSAQHDQMIVTHHIIICDKELQLTHNSNQADFFWAMSNAIASAPAVLPIVTPNNSPANTTANATANTTANTPAIGASTSAGQRLRTLLRRAIQGVMSAMRAAVHAVFHAATNFAAIFR